MRREIPVNDVCEISPTEKHVWTIDSVGTKMFDWWLERCVYCDTKRKGELKKRGKKK